MNELGTVFGDGIEADRLAFGWGMRLTAQELAGKLQRIDHLNITPDLLAPLLPEDVVVVVVGRTCQTSSCA